jgi:hypothetical protein
MLSIKEREIVCIPLGAPLAIGPLAGRHYIWDEQVTQTRSDQDRPNFREFEADKLNHNFGVGDLVQYGLSIQKSAPWTVEGTVESIHQYMEFDPLGRTQADHHYYTFGARVSFSEQSTRRMPFKLFIPSPNLEAVTNDHVVFNEEAMNKYKDIVDEPLDFEAASDDLKKILVDPVSRALWMGYNLHHVATETGAKQLITSAKTLALASERIDRKKLPLWLVKNMRPTVKQETWGVWMASYVTGEKVATFVQKPKETEATA